MRVGVISDSHDRLPLIDQALSRFRELHAEVLIHAGDLVAPFAARRLLAWTGPRHVIYGNNDGERGGLRDVLPDIQDGPIRIELGSRRALIHHFVDWCRPEDISGADVVITGHTHEAVNESRGGTLYLNPGECCGWVTGRCSVALLETDDLSARIIDLEP